MKLLNKSGKVIGLSNLKTGAYGKSAVSAVAPASPTAVNMAARYIMNTGITDVGGAASVWADQSGNGRDLLQGSAGSRPAIHATGYLTFDGTDDFMQATFTLNAPVSVYMVVNLVSLTTNDNIFNGKVADIQIYKTTGSADTVLYSSASLTDTSGNFHTGKGFQVIGAVFNGASSAFYVNDYAAVTGNVGTGNPGGFTLASNKSGTAGNCANIVVKEVIIYSAAHDATAAGAIIDYLQYTYGVA
jgi:hypothetical protein